MALKISVKKQEKVSAILQPQLDKLEEINLDLCKEELVWKNDPSPKALYKTSRRSLRKLKDCLKDLSNFLGGKPSRKRRDGHNKFAYIKKWQAARKEVDQEIAGKGIVKRMKKGSAYYKLVKAKLAYDNEVGEACS